VAKSPQWPTIAMRLPLVTPNVRSGENVVMPAQSSGAASMM